MRHYQCHCGNVLFFDNSICLQCGTGVGYDMATDQMIALEPGVPFQRCANGLGFAVCNWVVPTNSREPLCPSCQLSRTIPDLTVQANVEAWHKIENAKRRILYALARLGLTPLSKVQDAVNGLAFDFLRPTAMASVLTGHEAGVITVNVDEAEDLERERQRAMFGETYRTLVGHFRHEVAHYYWDRFFQGRADNDPMLLGFREVFGDERADYNAALARHYQAGPAAAAPGTFISNYAACHPWEDWAETWAHYLHMIDGTETAKSFGLNSEAVPIPFTPFPEAAVTLPVGLVWLEGEGEQFLSLLHAWAKLAPAINEIVASLGHPTFYPFVFSTTIIRKFFFVHHMVQTFAHDGAAGLVPDQVPAPLIGEPVPVSGDPVVAPMESQTVVTAG